MAYRTESHSDDYAAAFRGSIMAIPALIWVFAYMFYLLPLVFIFPERTFADRSKHIRRWSRVALYLLGMSIETTGEEHFNAPEPRIIAFNHVNSLDLLVLTALWQDDWTVIYKQEFHSIPMMGFLMHFFGMIPIDRSNRQKAKQSLDRANRDIQKKNSKVLIAPEGTRSGDGRLLPFKKGPFLLALATKAPIVPMVIYGNEKLTRGFLQPVRSGVIYVDFLPPVATEHWSSDNLNQQIELIRHTFLQHPAIENSDK